MDRHDPGSDRRSENRTLRETEGPRAFGRRQLREILRGRRRQVFAHHGPADRHPVQAVLSIAVLASSGTAGDALDDAFFVLGPERSRAYLKQLPGTETMFFLSGATRPWTMVRLRSRWLERLQ